MKKLKGLEYYKDCKEKVHQKNVVDEGEMIAGCENARTKYETSHVLH